MINIETKLMQIGYLEKEKKLTPRRKKIDTSRLLICL